MAEKIKVTELELESIKNIQTDYNKKIVEFGQLKLRTIELEEQFNEVKNIELGLQEDLKILQATEKKLAKELSDKYGNGKLDTNTGFFEKVG